MRKLPVFVRPLFNHIMNLKLTVIVLHGIYFHASGSPCYITLPTENISTVRDTYNTNLFNTEYFVVGYYPRRQQSTKFDNYNHTSLIPFVKKIRTRFSNIVIDGFTQNQVDDRWSVAYVSLAVAMVNNEVVNNNQTQESFQKRFLQVFMQFILESAEDILGSRLDNRPTPFDVIKRIADEANKQHNGTVQHLLLEVPGISASNFDRILHQLDYAIRISSNNANFSYKVGAVIQFYYCEQIGKISRESFFLEKILKKISLVIFKLLPSERQVLQGADLYLNRLKIVFSKCLTKVKGLNSRSRVGFFTSWPDTDKYGKRNVTAMTTLWQQLNSWAAENGAMVITSEAFDDPANPGTGWWTIEKGNVYSFLEKLDNNENDDSADGTSKQVKYTDWNVGGAQKSHFLLAKKFNVSFPQMADTVEHRLHLLLSRQSFGVTFPTTVTPNSTLSTLSEQDVAFLLSVIHTRFSNVLTSSIVSYSRTLQHSKLHIARAAAFINKAVMNHKYRHEINAPLENIHFPLQIFIPFQFDSNSDLIASTENSFVIAKTLADKANAIYPNTVSYLLIDLIHTLEDLDQWEKVSSMLQCLRESLTKQNHWNGSETSQLGAILYPKYLNSKRFNNMAIQYLLPHVKLVLLYLPTSPTDVKLGVDSAINRVTQTFEAHKKVFINCFPNLQVGIISKWSENGESYRRKPVNLINFWEALNAFAVKAGTLVFLQKAFDNSNEEDIEPGWWRLLKVNSLGTSNDYIIQEKYQLAHPYTRTLVHSANNDQSQRGLSDVTMVAVVLLSAIAIIVSIGLVGLFVVRKVRRQSSVPGQIVFDRELNVFFNGAAANAIGSSEENEEWLSRLNELLNLQAYDTTMEIQKGSFTMDTSSQLGSGAFGSVCLGQIFKHGRSINVAVKRGNSKTLEESLGSLSSLLSEIKVLSFLGHHQNIVGLMGAYTSDIKHGTLFVFLELCSLGSLKKFLRKLSKVDGIESCDADYLRLDEKQSETQENMTELLTKWALDIVNGMIFLASKHVVHADLATRNVLLTGNKVAKICDFGLSRRMVNYESYVKTKQEPLPWRYMAPESLSGFEFNEKTDVWSFGVTLWEIFTLGEVPYGGLSWDASFAPQLKNGLRLPQPEHEKIDKDACDKIYQIMQKCWEINPQKRPSFNQIKTIFIEI